MHRADRGRHCGVAPTRPPADVPGSLRLARSPDAGRLDHPRAAQGPTGRDSAEEQEERVRSLLSEVGLSPQAVGRYPHEFSGGQRQRIGLARALALDPKLIVADEPVSALDVSIQAQILNLMKDLQRRHGLTFVMISHDLAVVRYMADTIGVMYLGKLVEVGPAAEVYERPGPPLHPGPARRRPGARGERQGPHGGPDGGAGRAALGRRPPVGVPVPHPVPPGRGALRRGGAAAQPTSGPGTSPPATSRCRRRCR